MKLPGAEQAVVDIAKLRITASTRFILEDAIKLTYSLQLSD